MTASGTASRSLRRIFGVGFTIALAFGNTVGVGILRLPGTVAAALGGPALVAPIWILGGLYATLGAISVSELAAMSPTAGGFYVYARRAFGRGFGFAIGWNDWIQNCITIAYVALTGAEFLTDLTHAPVIWRPVSAVAIIALFAGLQWIGIRIGGLLQNSISAAVGVLLIALTVACFVIHPAIQPRPVAAGALSSGHALALSVGLVAGVTTALRSVIVTYDGWYGAIYMAEETLDAPRTIPRAMIGCAVLVTALYTLINLGFLHALPFAELARSTQPAADIAGLIIPGGGAQFVTIVSILTLLGLVNAILLVAPRILYAAGRDGLFTDRATEIGAAGTPRLALSLTALCACALVMSGTLQQLVAVAAVIFVLNYVSTYVALFVLRFKEPEARRPFRAWGYPVSTGVVLAGSVIFLGLTIAEDHRSALYAALLMVASAPVYAWLSRRKAQA